MDLLVDQIAFLINKLGVYMKKIISILITIGVFSIPSVVQAYDDWIKADKINSQSIDSTYVRCFYQTSMFGAFANQRFSFIIQGDQFSCPYQVEYNPTTGEWRE